MKKIKITIVSMILTVILLVGCTDEKSTSYNEVSSNRIKIKERREIDGAYHYILEVDGSEYLTQHNGGFIKLGK